MKCLLALLLALAGCQGRKPASVHYELGAAYQSAGVWHYPREEFTRTETGLAEVTGAHPAPTADGEAFDATALAAAHPTLQLPALARITALDTGRSLVVRVNDRGPVAARRSLGLTRRAAELLGSPDFTAIPYRLELLADESRALAAALRPDAALAMQSAPTGAVQSEALAPPAGATRSASQVTARTAAAPVSTLVPTPVLTPAATPPQRLAETVTQSPRRAFSLAIDCAAFSRSDYANLLRARLQSLGATTTTDYAAPRDRAYVVRIPGISSAAEADRLLQLARNAGATDARIVID